MPKSVAIQRYPSESSDMDLMTWCDMALFDDDWGRNCFISLPSYLFRPFHVPNHISSELSWNMVVTELLLSPELLLI